MTEIERLKADLATIQKAAKIAKEAGFHERTGNYDQVEGKLKQRIADIEAKQAPEDEWWAVKGMIGKFSDDYDLKKYVRHLEAKVAELENELRCKRIDGGKVRDDLKAIDAEKNREKLAELTTIYNAIPPACGLAKELVEKRIEGVKKQLQESEAGQ